MKYQKLLSLVLLFYTNFALAEKINPDSIATTPVPSASTLDSKKQETLNTTTNKQAPGSAQQANSSKPGTKTENKIDGKTNIQLSAKSNISSLQNLKKLGSISTEQAKNIGFDIKAASIVNQTNIKATSLTQITSVKITSFTHTVEGISSVPAAMYVITNDEIKRMGVKQLANVLRFAPGVAVVQAGANSWYITVRGFAGSAANKLLVMIDGRSIYSTLYGGVLWQQQDYFLEDIERIEIIRGPGGVIWGANAMNGVINIITKNSKNTQGTIFTAGGGYDNQVGAGRVGKQMGKETYGRVYVKTSHLNKSEKINIDDDGVMTQTGFRVDKFSKEVGDITFSGDIYKGGIGPKLNGLQKILVAQEYTGNDLLFNWSYNANEKQNHQFHTYLDYTNLNVSGGLIDKRQTFDAQYQLSQTLQSQQVIAGATVRRVRDSIPTFPLFVFVPQSKTDKTYGGFVQDDITLLVNKAHFIVGTKYEHNSYTGAEWQPSVRGTYNLEPDNLLWAAWSRAVRVPTRIEEDFTIPTAPFAGNTHLRSESASVYEAGWRKKWDRLSFDVAGFTSGYKNLVTTEGTTTGNKMSGRVSGFELTPSFQLQPGWLIRLNYSFAASDLHSSSSSVDTARPFLADNAYPRNMGEIISMWDINDAWQFNAYLRYMDSIRMIDTVQAFNTISSYVVADASIVWKQNKTINWQLVGRDLGRKHFEWRDVNSPKIGPSVALYLTVNIA